VFCGLKLAPKRADILAVKAILSVVVYLCFVVALGVMALASMRREECEIEVSDDDL
jgi:hypothetical protein